jgi:DNA-binding GntR family transcriptional regulator
MEHVVEIAAASGAVVETLQVAPGSALFFVDRLTYTTQAGQRVPAVWFRAYYRDTTLPLSAAFAER